MRTCLGLSIAVVVPALTLILVHRTTRTAGYLVTGDRLDEGERECGVVATEHVYGTRGRTRLHASLTDAGAACMGAYADRVERDDAVHAQGSSYQTSSTVPGTGGGVGSTQSRGEDATVYVVDGATMCAHEEIAATMTRYRPLTFDVRRAWDSSRRSRGDAPRCVRSRLCPSGSPRANHGTEIDRHPASRWCAPRHGAGPRLQRTRQPRRFEQGLARVAQHIEEESAPRDADGAAGARSETVNEYVDLLTTKYDALCVPSTGNMGANASRSRPRPPRLRYVGSTTTDGRVAPFSNEPADIYAHYRTDGVGVLASTDANCATGSIRCRGSNVDVLLRRRRRGRRRALSHAPPGRDGDADPRAHAARRHARPRDDRDALTTGFHHAVELSVMFRYRLAMVSTIPSSYLYTD